MNQMSAADEAVRLERFRRFVAVLELGERFPRRTKREPLHDVSELWRKAAGRANAKR
jgi:hypothetical protein